MTETTETGGEPGTGRQKAGTPGWIKLLLVVSLALNLLVAGLAAGFILRGPPSSGFFAGVPVDGIRSFQRAMPDSERAALRRDLRARSGEFRRLRADMQQMREQLLAELSREPFSEQEFRAVIDRQAELLQAAGLTLRDVLTARVAAMDPQTRAEFAQRLRAEGRRGGERERKP